MKIKFWKRPHWERREATTRRIAAAKRFLQREQDKMPLFAADIARQQPTPEERIARHEEWAHRQDQALRDHAARCWVQGRAILRRLEQNRAEQILDAWNNEERRGPRDAPYFIEHVRAWLKKFAAASREPCTRRQVLRFLASEICRMSRGGSRTLRAYDAAELLVCLDPFARLTRLRAIVKRAMAKAPVKLSSPGIPPHRCPCLTPIPYPTAPKSRHP